MQINTRYNIGDAVYILDGYHVQCANILGVKFEQHGEAKASVIYTFGVYPMRKEAECFPTKESLIQYLSK